MSQSNSLSALTGSPDSHHHKGAKVSRPPSRWFTRLAIPLAIAITVALLFLYAARESLMPAIEVHAISVATRARSVGEGAAGVHLVEAVPSVVAQAPGWIEPDPYAVNVAALADGVVREVLVLEGETVEADQVVARMIDDDAQIAVQAGEAAVSAATARLHGAEAHVGTAKAQVAIESAAADVIRDELDRKKPLAESETIAFGEFRRLELQLRAAEARVEAARGVTIEAEARVAQAKAEVRLAEAELAAARLRLDRMNIRAPSEGIVLARLAEPGSRMMVGGQESNSAVAVRLYNPARLQVRADIPLADAAKIGVDMPAIMTTDALPDREFAGRVSRIVHEADIQKNTVEVKVSISDPVEALKPEMLVRVRFMSAAQVLGEDPGQGIAHATAGLAVFAPENALTNVRGDQAAIWIVNEATSSAEMRQATIGGLETNGWREIRTGVTAGDRVIVDPPASLSPGARIRVRESKGGAT